jgi:hypothetical protein
MARPSRTAVRAVYAAHALVASWGFIGAVNVAARLAGSVAARRYDRGSIRAYRAAPACRTAPRRSGGWARRWNRLASSWGRWPAASPGVPATAMIDALIDGERRGQVLADLARGRMREAGKLAGLSMALAGGSPGTMRWCAGCTGTGSRPSMTRSPGWRQQITARAAPWQRELDLLETIPGFGDAVAPAWLAEIGPAPPRHFASHQKLACWVSLCPGSTISAGKRKHGRTGDAGPASSRCWSRRPGPR